MEILIALLCGNSLAISFKMFLPLSEATPDRLAMVDTFIKHLIISILNLILFVSARASVIFIIIGVVIGLLNAKIYFHIMHSHSTKYVKRINFYILILNVIAILFYCHRSFLLI